MDMLTMANLSSDINNQSVTDVTESTYVPYEAYSIRPETYIVPVVFSLIFITGVVGNGTLIFIYIKHRAMRTVPNTFVLSLAAGDMLIMFASVPFTGLVYAFESYPFGEAICIASDFAQHMSVGVSVFTLAVLSAERYWAIVDPLGKRLSRGNKATVTTICFIWVISAFLALPVAVNTSVHSHRSNVMYFDSDGIPYNTTMEILYCSPFPADWQELGYPQGVVACRFLIYYAVPLLVIAFYYVRMAKHLMNQARDIPGEASISHGSTLRVRKKVAKMVLIFVSIFFVCFAPHYIFSLWFWFHAYYSDGGFTAFWNGFRIFAFCLSFANSCINPIALIFVSGTYRKYFREYAVKCSCFKKDERRVTRTLMERGTSLRTTKSEIVVTHHKLHRDMSQVPNSC